jgi:carboxymethylenebutenolidase
VDTIDLTWSGGRLPVVVADPAVDGPASGVVVVHDVFGMTDDLRRQVAWLAALGYRAAAPDLLAGGRVRCTVAAFRALRSRSGPVFEQIETVRRWLAEHPGGTGRVGVIGFCLGGGFALLLAGDRGFDVSSVNYGEVPDDADVVLRSACPVVGSFGGRDRTLSGAAARLEAALAGNGIPHDIVEYAEAGHGFMNRHRGPFGVGQAVLGVVGVRFDADADADARRRIAAFFATHLAATPGSGA